MMGFTRSSRRGRSIASPARRAAAVLLASLAGGCSAEISSFDFPSFSLNDDKKDQTSALQSSSAGRGPSYLGNDGPPGASANNSGYNAGRTYRDNGVNVANLPEPPPSSNYAASGGSYGAPPTPPPYGRYGTAPASNRAVADRRYDPAPAPAASSGLRPGEMVEVQPGDTLYALSHRHHVAVAELMQLNGLSNPNLHPGQKLYLPEGYDARRPLPRSEPVATAMAAPSVSPEVGARYSSSYTMKAGDSVYALSKSYGVPVAELQQVNGITDTRTVRAGTVLKVPGNGGPQHTEPAQQVAVAAPPAANDSSSYASSTNQPTILNRRDQPGAGRPNDVATGAINPPPAHSSSGSGAASDKLRWPVSGKIITGFGQRNDGTHNDGINLSVPLGTSVHAAEGGTVAYAGSELKGYGNLILLRHDNGWVTAYAHNEQLMVKRGDKVQRGQVIATAGRSGSVDQPQVHFELRQGSKPVDPVPFLERL